MYHLAMEDAQEIPEIPEIPEIILKEEEEDRPKEPLKSKNSHDSAIHVHADEDDSAGFTSKFEALRHLQKSES